MRFAIRFLLLILPLGWCIRNTVKYSTNDGFEYFQHTCVYGKYWTLDQQTDAKDTECNTYYLYTPTNVTNKFPLIMQFHGGGFTGGSATRNINSEIQSYLESGIAYASMDYRLVGTNYYFGDEKNKEDMEFIHINSTGHLWLDTDGMKMHDYKVKIGRQEYNTMCSYDAAMGLEHLINNAEAFNLDVQRIGLTGGSAGGGEINYLTWVYHSFNPSKYRPVSMVYRNAQLDYPVQNMLDRAWSLWADDIGAEKKLSDILNKNDCSMIVGNPFCDATPIDFICNKTWNDESQTRFCGSNFDQITLQDLINTQVWPMDTEQDKGIATLWYTSVNMQKYAPKPFYMLIANKLNSTAGMNVVHNALYSRNYAKFAEMAGINYTVYYTDYKDMTAQDKGTMRFVSGGSLWNYRSNFDWINQPGVKDVTRVSENEYLLFHCFAMGVKNCGKIDDLTVECKSEIKLDCADSLGDETKCENCIHHNARDLIAHTCPTDQGAAQRCIAYCTHPTS